MGTETATAWGCDLTYDYVKINGDIEVSKETGWLALRVPL